ncbi:exostoses (multiple)-like 2 [Xenoophorus captivus]|uniref:Exostoses (Multiple)-like 2 n=1 Tax=Xenoophorus captivus TaxID=1517983 RepID=A0ABV0RAJ5_9TELE
MVLIGAAFFHQRYLQLFQDQPKQVHSLVDETQNCDDIAVNFAVALHLRKYSKSSPIHKPSGIFVKPVDLRNLEKDASSGYQGMWHRPEHLLQRSYCLNRLTQIYGFMPLCYSNLMVVLLVSRSSATSDPRPTAGPRSSTTWRAKVMPQLHERLRPSPD